MSPGTAYTLALTDGPPRASGDEPEFPPAAPAAVPSAPRERG